MIDDHNGPQWLVVRYIEQRGKTSRQAFWPGWYVVRTCPCHFGEPVTVHYAYESDVLHARDVILSVSAKANAALGVGD
jgi:hypothetical protein